MEYLISNKEWIFSGIGIFIIGGIIGLFKLKLKEPEKKKSIKYQNGNNNIQTDGQVNINNTTNIYKEVEQKKKDKDSSISPLTLLANKFYKVFEDHGVSRGQIPSFVDKKFDIQYKDVEDEKSIIPKLNDELLDWVAKKFEINRSWFDASEGDLFNGKLYTTIDCYKNIHAFMNLLENLIDEVDSYSYRHSIRVSFYKNFKNFEGDESTYNARVIIVVKVKIGKTTTGSVYKYIMIEDNLRWDYWKSRQDIKRIIRILERFRIPNDGYDLTDSEIDEITSLKIVPRAILEKFRMVTWYPYDYDGTFNERINELEYETSKEFQNSLKAVDDMVLNRLKDKRII